jgi:hypothetical protein
LDGTHAVKLNREDAFKFARLRLLDSKIVDETLTIDESRAVVAHLSKNYGDVVALLTENQLFRMISETPVSLLPTAEQRVGDALPYDLLYKQGEHSDACTLVLVGKVTVVVGADQFRSDVSSWCLLAANALDDINFKPDFSAFVSAGPCRCIQIARARFAAAVDASATERREIQHSANHSFHDVAVPLDGGEIENAERTRQAKLMTALVAVESKNVKKNEADNEKLSSSIVFAEAGAVSTTHAQRPAPSKPKTALPKNESEDESKPSQFEFITTPASREKSDDEDNEEKF